MPTTRAGREDQYEGETYDEDEAYDEDNAYDEDEAYEDEEASEQDDSGGQVTTASAAAKAAVDQITQLIAKEPAGVVAVEPGDDGWHVSIEVIEDRRIPSSADILAVYEAAIASSGDLTSYRRVRRYGRGQGDGGREQ